MFKKTLSFFVIFLSFFVVEGASAHLPRIVQDDAITVLNPKISQAFYGELLGQPAEYFISSDIDFNLYINLLVPKSSNPEGIYSASVFQVVNGEDNLVAFIDGSTFTWKEYWEEFGRDFYTKGPEFERMVDAGDYKIVISGMDNQGKYVLAIGKQEKFPISEILKVYYVLPVLKITFFQTSVWEFFKTPFVLFGAMILVGIFLIIDVIVFLIGKAIKKSKPKSIFD